MKLINKIIVFCLLSTSALAQEKMEKNEVKIRDLEIGTTFNFDGKKLRELQSSCPSQESESIINGKKVKVVDTSISSLSFTNGKIGCLSRDHNAFQRFFSIATEVPPVTPLICTVKEVEIDSENILHITFNTPCDFSIFGSRHVLDPRNIGDMTLGSLMYNLGATVKIIQSTDNKSASTNFNTRVSGKEVSSSKQNTEKKVIKVNQQ